MTVYGECMSSILYPSGYGRDELTLDALMGQHCPVAVTEPEFRRRLRHFLQSKRGRIGIGDILPRPWGAQTSGASASNRSFHQQQTFHDGTMWCAAVDLVVRREAFLGHSSGAVPWSEVPAQGSQYAQDWGVHINVPGEPWHIQCIEMDGFWSWTQAGRPRPTPDFQLPCQPELPPDPVLTFDPRNGLWGLWPVNDQKPRLGSRTFVAERAERGDTRWQWTGDGVEYAQGVIFHKAGGNISIDGYFGPETERRVKDVQQVFGKHVDGLIGPDTWGVIDFLAGR